MSSTPLVAAAGDSRASFLRARLASLLAVAPLSVWAMFHIWSNLAVFQGPDAWQSAVTEHAHPVAQLLTLMIVLLPLVLHAVWGVGRLFSARPNNVRYGFYGNLKYAVQRLTAVGTLMFLGAHIWLAMLKPQLLEGHAEEFTDIAREMHSHMPTLTVYLLGTLGVAFHLANGLQTFAMGWGLVSSRRALRRLDAAAILLFLLLLAMSWGAIYGLWRAGSAF